MGVEINGRALVLEGVTASQNLPTQPGFPATQASSSKVSGDTKAKVSSSKERIGTVPMLDRALDSHVIP